MTFDPASTDLNILPRSRVERAGVEYGLVRGPAGNHLVILSSASIQPPAGFSGEWSEQGGRRLQICPLTPANAAALRKHLPWLQPRPLGLKTSAGLGDRLGLATPGHVRAVRAVGGNIHPIFSQQSIRENTRTGRNPQQVLDDATWGAFSEGWQGDLGADADHLKTPADIDQCLAAGYSFFTIDPGEHVNNLAEISSLNDLNQMAEHLPAEIRPQASGLLGKTFKIEDLLLHFDEAVLLKAAVKYGRAVLHVAGMYRHLVKSAGAFPVELEVSVDETDLPTSHAEHVYIASELTRLGVKWVSLAPRYVGRFEKGVDYIGDLNLFEADFAGHAAIARHFGPYKLSLHSGSDKFSIYPIASRLTQGLVHLKTAGTSYLEALRCLAGLDEGLFREIYTFTRDRYPSDRASYHVSADLSRAPAPEEGMDWPGILNQFDAREILHVTFGSVLTQTAPDGKKLFFDRLMGFLAAHPDEYASALEKHFIRHLTPFVQPGLAPQP